MRRIAIALGVLLGMVACIVGSARWATVRDMNEIRSLKGRRGPVSALLPRFSKWRVIGLGDALYLKKDGFAGRAGLVVYEYPGQGLPYFVGYVVYDSVSHEIVAAAAEELGKRQTPTSTR